MVENIIWKFDQLHYHLEMKPIAELYLIKVVFLGTRKNFWSDQIVKFNDFCKPYLHRVKAISLKTKLKENLKHTKIHLFI